MACFKPLKAMRSSQGVQILPGDAAVWNLSLPCGQCVGCRLARSREWATRIMFESSLWRYNSFITLTYDDAHLPEDGGLHHRDFQLFLKRFRKNHPDLTIRYYMAGEYGENYGRPHFHACIFNYGFNDRSYLKTMPSGSKLYTSRELERLWPYGFSSVGDLTFESAAYVARYVMKKVTGRKAESHYETMNPSTGEIFKRRPDYNKMSLRPGIGAGWFDKFRSDVYPHDYVVVNSAKPKPPRYFDKLLKRVDSAAYEYIKEQRELDNREFNPDNLPTRLAVREIVTEARLSSLTRKLK